MNSIAGVYLDRGRLYFKCINQCTILLINLAVQVVLIQ